MSYGPNMTWRKTDLTVWFTETQRPGVSLAEAAAKINDFHLEVSLDRIWGMDIPWPAKFLKFSDYFEREFAGVALPPQLPWLKKYTKLSDVIDLPLKDLPEDVYHRSVKWIDKFPTPCLAGYIQFAVFCMIDHLTHRHIVTVSHEAVNVVVAMVLRTRPIALIDVLPYLGELRQDMVPATVWMMAQASQGDLCLGFFSWVHKLLPLLVGDKKNPYSTDLILQLLERILQTSNALPILIGEAAARAAARTGEELLIPLPSFEIFLRLTFPASSATEQATQRFQAIYPLFKIVALAGATNLEALEIFTLSLKLAGEGNPVLAEEATAIALWSVTGNISCCVHWDDLYNEHLEASVSLLKKLVYESEHYSLKLSSSPRHYFALKRTIKTFSILNEQSITQGVSNASLYIEADNSCKVILERLSLPKSITKEVSNASLPIEADNVISPPKTITKGVSNASLSTEADNVISPPKSITKEVSNASLPTEADNVISPPKSITKGVSNASLPIEADNVISPPKSITKGVSNASLPIEADNVISPPKSITKGVSNASLPIEADNVISPPKSITQGVSNASLPIEADNVISPPKSITKGVSNASLSTEADNSCKVILGKLSRPSGFFKAFIIIAFAIAFASVFLSSLPWITTKLLRSYVDAITTGDSDYCRCRESSLS